MRAMTEPEAEVEADSKVHPKAARGVGKSRVRCKGTGKGKAKSARAGPGAKSVRWRAYDYSCMPPPTVGDGVGCEQVRRLISALTAAMRAGAELTRAAATSNTPQASGSATAPAAASASAPAALGCVLEMLRDDGDGTGRDCGDAAVAAFLTRELERLCVRSGNQRGGAAATAGDAAASLAPAPTAVAAQEPLSRFMRECPLVD